MNLNYLHFGNVTLLITHYNRSQSLRRLLETFSSLNVTFAEIVVSDDCSKSEHLNALKKMAEEMSFTLVTTPKNGGLGHNINKGQAIVTTPYTLYVQEDFVPTPAFASGPFQHAVASMDRDQSIDMFRFYSYILYPYLKPADLHGFSEMYLPFPGLNYKKIYQYSDHPHLRRSNFLEKFGKYKEGVSVDRAEYGMCVAFLRKKGKAYFYNDFKALFIQKNSSDEPSTADRNNWRNSSNIFVRTLRNTYRQIKYNYDIYVA